MKKMLVVLLLALPGSAFSYPSFLASPGESIDFTWFDQQSNCSVGRMIVLDSLGPTDRAKHVCYMKSINATHTPRNAAYQFNDGTGWTGELDANTQRAGYPNLDVLSDGRAVVVFHQAGGRGSRGVVAMDAVRGAGAFTVFNVDTITYPPGTTSPFCLKVAVGPTDVIHITACGMETNGLYYCRFAPGDTSRRWVLIDTLGNALSNVVFASRTSGKVAIAWCISIDNQPNNQHNCNLWYIESTDHGRTWGQKVNVTNYQVADTIRAYCDVSGVYDNSDIIHLVWTGVRWTGPTQLWNRSAIWHWSASTGISLVSGMVPPWGKWPGTFWWDQDSSRGDWKRGADRPSLSIDARGRLYCVWAGQIIPADISAGGYTNGDLYGRGSADNGRTWGAFGRTDTMIYITNSHTPGAPPGACSDDGYHSITRVTTDSVRILFIEDKDAGSSVAREGTTVPCPVKYLAVKADWFWPVGVEVVPSPPSPVTSYRVFPNPFLSFATAPGHEGERFALYDVSGRLVGTYKGDKIGHDLGPGIYFLCPDPRNPHPATRILRIVKLR